jgi:hypothetical protein
VIGLGVQFSANANGMTRGLSQVDRQLQNLGKQASQAARLFDGFASSSGAAATAQQQVATDIGFLTSAFKTGQISAQEYASQLQAIVGAARESSAAFAEGARITENVATAEERRVAQLQRLDDLLAAGAISQETYSRAVEQASGAAAAAAAATAASERERARVIAEGAAVTASLQTVQEKRAAELERLAGLLSAGAISEETYARAVEIASGAQAEAEAAERARQRVLEEGARVAEKYATDEEKRAREIARLDSLLASGAISEETYARAIGDASGAKAEAARVDQQRASDSARAAQIIEANLSAEERASRDYAASVAELDRLVAAGLLTEADYAKAVERSAAAFAKATLAADRYEDAADGAGDAGVLKFNELSGVLAAIPGPIGNVAGRLSGLASAGEGLGRVFSGGIGQGLASIGTSVAGLVNPFTAGLAAVAAFGAGATAVASSLLELDDRVEKLGNAADKLGVSFGFIQVIEEAAARSGVSFEQVNAATTRLLKTLAGADEESKAATQALDRLGLSLGDLESLSPEDQFRAIGDALTGIEDPAKRVAAATALFGRAGAELLPFFNNLDKAATDIERFGRALDNVDRRRVDEFGDSVDAVKVATRQLGTEITLPFVGLGEGINQAAAEFLGGINSIVGPIGDVLEPVLSGLGAAFELVGVIIGGIGRTIGAVLAPIGDLAQAFGSVGEVFNDAFVDVIRYLVDASVATTEWLVSFSGVSVLADGIIALSSGFDALSASLAPVAELAQRIGTVVSEAFSQLSAAVSSAISSTVGNIAEAVQAFGEFTGISGLISSFADSVTSAFTSIWEGIRNVVSQVGGFIESVVSFAENWLGIQRTIEEPIVAELDLSQPLLAAEQFSKEIGDAATKAAEFGEAGFQAALRYQEALEQVAQLQADGTFSAEEAKRAAEQAEQSFETTIAGLGREAEAQRKAAEEAQKAADEKIAAAERAADAAIQADQRRADSFIASQGLGGEDPATAAAENLLAVTRQIEEAEAAIVAARAAGDAAAEQAATRRLAILDQAEAAAQETVEFGFSSRDAARAIEEVRGRLDETFTFDNFEIAPEAFAAAQDQLRQLELDLEAKVIDPDTFEEAADAIRRGFDDALRTAEQIRDLNEQYAERAAQIDAERIEALSQVSQQPLQIEDVRTGAGISEFLRLATGREDPAIAEYRKQLSELQKIAREIRELGGVVEIVGAN